MIQLRGARGRALRVARPRAAAARMMAERHALATWGQDQPRQAGRILCYHSLGQKATWGVNDVAAERFRRQIESALEAGYTFVQASVIARTGGLPNELAVTFDDSPASVLTTAAPMLASYGVPFTVFVVSDWTEGIAGPGREQVLSWDDVIYLASHGAEIGNHSSTHPNFSRTSRTQAADEIGRARELIEARSGIATTTFAIPFGQSGNWPSYAADVARDEGYDIVYAQGENTRPEGTVPRTFVTTFDRPHLWRALLRGRYDGWEEWY